MMRGTDDGPRRTEKYPRQRISILGVLGLLMLAAGRRLRRGRFVDSPASFAAR